jgi:hypothetical protein
MCKQSTQRTSHVCNLLVPGHAVTPPSAHSDSSDTLIALMTSGYQTIMTLPLLREAKDTDLLHSSLFCLIFLNLHCGVLSLFSRWSSYIHFRLPRECPLSNISQKAQYETKLEHSEKKRPTWTAKNSWDGQQMSFTISTSSLPCSEQLPPGPYLGRESPAHTFVPLFFNLRYTIILPSLLRLPLRSRLHVFK